MAGCSIREEGLRAAALPGRVAAAYPMTLDAGPRADERVGYINQRVLGVALREQIFLWGEYKPSHLCGRPWTRRRRAGDAKGPQNYLTPEHTAASHASQNLFFQSWDSHEIALHFNLHPVKKLIDGVRKHGSYKRYVRAPHRDVRACRGLAMRGKLRTDHRALAFIAKQGDNGVVWNILSYWRAAD